MANRYWVGGSANWDTTAGTKWASTSGGTGGQAAPTSSDDVFFDANSGAVTVTSTATVSIGKLNFTGFTGTFAGTGQIQIYGSSVILGSGMTYTHTGNMFCVITGAVSIKSNGITNTSRWIFGSGANATNATLQDNFIAGLIQPQVGTFDANGYDVTTPGMVFPTGSSPVLNMGSGTWTLTSTTSIWNVAGTPTINAQTSTIKVIGSATTKTFVGGGLTYNNIWLNMTSPGAVTVSGSNTFNDFRIDPGVTVKFTAGTTQTVSSFNAKGTSVNPITLDSTTTATFALTKTSGVVSCDFMNIQHCVASGGAIWYAGANSTDNQAVTTAGSGWIFAASPTGIGQGLMAYYKLDGSSADSAFSNNGTDTSISYTTGKINNGASFNGSSSFIGIPSVAALQIVGALSLSAWIKISSLSGGGRIACKSNGDISNYEFEFGYGSDGSLNFTSSNNSNYFNASTAASLITTGTWIHVALVKSGNASGDTVKFYVNGVPVSSTVNSANPSFVGASSTDVTIGKRTNGGSPIFLNGMVDELGIWNRPLFSSEIAVIYNNSNALAYPLPSSLASTLAAYYKLDGNSTESVFANNGTDTSITYSSGNGKVNNGAGFNGSTSKIVSPSASQLNAKLVTVSAWVKTSSASEQTIVDKPTVTPIIDPYSFYILKIDSSGYARGWVSIGGVRKIVNGSASIADGAFHMLTMTYDGAYVRLYVDAVQVAATAATGSVDSGATSLYIGQGGNAAAPATWNGAIDEVSIWAKGLSTFEIMELYNSNTANQYPFQTVTTRSPVNTALVQVSGDFPSYQTTNFPNQQISNINASYSGSYIGHIIAKIDVTGMSSSAVKSASINFLILDGAAAVGRTFSAYKLSKADWAYNQATFNIYKTASNWTTGGGDYVTSSPSGGAVVLYSNPNETWLSIDVTAIVKDAIDNNAGIADIIVGQYTNASGAVDILVYDNGAPVVVRRPFVEILTNFSAYTATLTETIALADTLSRVPIRSLAEIVSLADTILRTLSKTLAEAITVAASMVRTASRLLVETIAYADSLLKNQVRTLVETITSTDTFAFLKVKVGNWTETITHTDTFKGIISSRVLTEAITFTDSMLRIVTRTLAESITFTASFLKSFVKTLSETITHTATLVKSPVRTLTETITHADTLIRMGGKILSETITVTATMLRSMTRLLSEAITHADILAKSVQRTFAETITWTASMIRMGSKTLVEAITHTATFVGTGLRIRLLTETITLIPQLIVKLNGIITNGWSKIARSLDAWSKSTFTTDTWNKTTKTTDDWNKTPKDTD